MFHPQFSMCVFMCFVYVYLLKVRVYRTSHPSTYQKLQKIFKQIKFIANTFAI